MAMNQNIPMDPTAGQDPTASAGVPMGDSSNPAAPSATPSGDNGMATPEELATLKDLMDKIEEKYRAMNAEAFAGGNQTETFRKDLIVDVFKALQSAGIDISNVESVKQFLDELQQSNPDLYEIFVEAFNGLLGQGDTGAGATGAAAPSASGLPQGGALAAMAMGATPPGGAPTGAPVGAPDMSASANATPSNEGLSGMMPPTSGGLAGKFPNLAGK